MSIEGEKLLKQVNFSEAATEPAIKVGSFTGTVAGLASIALYLFPNLSEETIAPIFVGMAFLLPIITALFTRGQVWSPDSVRIVVDQAIVEATATANELKKDK